MTNKEARQRLESAETSLSRIAAYGVNGAAWCVAVAEVALGSTNPDMRALAASVDTRCRSCIHRHSTNPRFRWLYDVVKAGEWTWPELVALELMRRED